MIKNNEIDALIDAYDQLMSLETKKKGESIQKEAKHVSELAIKAFNAALEQDDPLKRFEMVNRIVSYMKKLIRYDSAMSEFLLAKKKMTNYALLEYLSDPNQVTFTLQDCALLSQRYHALHASESV